MHTFIKLSVLLQLKDGKGARSHRELHRRVGRNHQRTASRHGYRHHTGITTTAAAAPFDQNLRNVSGVRGAIGCAHTQRGTKTLSLGQVTANGYGSAVLIYMVTERTR
jgi:hypothetical protein